MNTASSFCHRATLQGEQGMDHPKHKLSMVYFHHSLPASIRINHHQWKDLPLFACLRSYHRADISVSSFTRAAAARYQAPGCCGPCRAENIINSGMQYLREKLILFLICWYESGADGEEMWWNVASGFRGSGVFLEVFLHFKNNCGILLITFALVL